MKITKFIPAFLAALSLLIGLMVGTASALIPPREMKRTPMHSITPKTSNNGLLKKLEPKIKIEKHLEEKKEKIEIKSEKKEEKNRIAILQRKCHKELEDARKIYLSSLEKARSEFKIFVQDAELKKDKSAAEKARLTYRDAKKKAQSDFEMAKRTINNRCKERRGEIKGKPSLSPSPTMTRL